MLCEFVSPSNFALTLSSPLMKTGPGGCLIRETQGTLFFRCDSKCSFFASEVKLTRHFGFPHYALGPLAWLYLQLTLTLTTIDLQSIQGYLAIILKIHFKLHFSLVLPHLMTIPPGIYLVVALFHYATAIFFC